MTEQQPQTYAELLELLKATIQEREVRFEAMRKRYDEIKQTYNEINPKHSEADKCFSEIKKCRTDMNTLFVEMPQQAAEVKKLLTSLSLHNTTLEKTFSKIEKQYSILLQRSTDTKTQKSEVNGNDVEVAGELQKIKKEVADLRSRVGRVIEDKIDPRKFKAAFTRFGYDILQAGKNDSFVSQSSDIGAGEIDVRLEGSDFIILVEEKQNLQISDITEHIKRLKKYQRYAERDKKDNRRVLGAMCGVDIAPGLEKATKENGLFLIHLNGKMVEILTKRENFTPTAWKYDSAAETNAE